MLNLIITVVSIALVAVLTAASVFYGGKAWSEGAVSANASHVISAAQQLSAGITLYHNSKAKLPDSMADIYSTPVSASTIADELMQDGFLTANPSVPSQIVSSLSVEADGSTFPHKRYVTAMVHSREVCWKIVERGYAHGGAMAFTCDEVLVDDEFQYGTFKYQF